MSKSNLPGHVPLLMQKIRMTNSKIYRKKAQLSLDHLF